MLIRGSNMRTHTHRNSPLILDNPLVWPMHHACITQ